MIWDKCSIKDISGGDSLRDSCTECITSHVDACFTQTLLPHLSVTWGAVWTAVWISVRTTVIAVECLTLPC